MALSLAIGLPGLPGEDRGTSPTGDERAAAGQDSPEQPADTPYAKTPPEMVPFRRFIKPPQRYFDKPLAYYGAGRDMPAPDLSKLKSVKIGVLVPLSLGWDSVIGRAVLQGAQLAIEEANKAGGYKGLPYEAVVRDDTGAWKGITHEMVKLAYDDQAWAMLGSVDGASTHVALRLAIKVQLAIVNTVSGDQTLTETRMPWLVRLCGDDRQVCYLLARHILKTMRHERVALLRDNSRYARMGLKEFNDAARRLGHPVTLEMRYDAMKSETDVASQLAKIRDYQADAVLLWGNAPDAGKILAQMRQQGLGLPVYGTDRLVHPELLKHAGAAAEGLVAAATMNPTAPNPLYPPFHQSFLKRFGSPPDAFAAHGYDGMKFLLRAVEKAGLNRVRIRDAIYDVRECDGVTGKIVLDDTGNDVGEMWLARVEKGEFRYFSPDSPDFGKTD